MFNAVHACGLWEWDPTSQLDSVEDDLGEVLRTNTLSRCNVTALLPLLKEADRGRLLAAARHAWDSRALLNETFEIPGSTGRIQIQLRSGSLARRSDRLVAVCHCEAQVAAAPSAEAELRDFLQNHLVDAIPLFIVVLNQEGDLHYVNRRTEEFLGYPLAELKEKDWITEFLEPDEQARIQTAISQAIQGLEPAGCFQVRVVSAVGEEHILEWSGCKAFSPSGTPDGKSGWMIGVGVDVTAREAAEARRKQDEQALQASEVNLKLNQAYLRAIFDSSPECIKVVDKNCRLLDMNQAGLRALEVDSLEQIRGADIREWLVPEDRDRYSQVVQIACSGHSCTGEFQMVGSRGTRRWMEQHAMGLIGSAGSTTREQMVSMACDVTERRQIQAELQERELHYRQLFEGMTEGFALHELIVNEQGEPIDYRYLDVNPAFETLTSQRRADVVGKLHSEISSVDKEFWIKTYGQVALTGQPLRMEYEHPKSGRQWIVLAYRTQPKQFAVLFSEVSRWRQAELERRIIHERLMMTINNAPLVLFSLDREGRVTTSEGKALTRVGLRPGELVGRTIAEVYPAASESLAAIDRALAGESVSFLAEGQGVFFDSYYAPLLDTDGQVIGMTGLAVDVTETTKVQAALRESEARLQLLLKYAPAGVAMFDRNLNYIAYSRRWLADYHLEGQDLLGRSHYEVFPEIPQRWRDVHSRCLQGAVERCERDLFQRVDGTNTWLRWEIQPWRDAEGNIGGLVFFTEDVSQQVQSEEEVESLRNQAAHAGRIATMGEMAAGIAHELNQPLAAINLYAEGCANAAGAGTLTQPESIAKFTEIGELADRCAEIIRRLRSFATKRENRRSSADLRDILAASWELLRHEYRNASVQCRMTIPEGPLRLFADTIQLQQVFINILRNALEATVARKDAKPLVELTAAAISGSQCRISVRDYGVGIPAEQIPELFTPFFTTKANGLGMGLKISTTIVRAHRGEIECRPLPDMGTEFVIVLPLMDPRTKEFT